ncbi:U4/U6 small nuclear ribonucleoprotein Prp3 [Galdieria sulphuraria]|nr:U4/U6 small nuclear ribonucleoprotein Prp3 [Galdieria sulphuraria]
MDTKDAPSGESFNRQRKKRSRFTDAPDDQGDNNKLELVENGSTFDTKPSQKETPEERIARLQTRIAAKMKASKVSLSENSLSQDPADAQRKQQLEEAAHRARMLAEKYAQTYGYNLQSSGEVDSSVSSGNISKPLNSTPGETVRGLSLEKIPTKPVSTLKLNEETYKQNRLKRVLKVDKSDFIETDPRKNPYYDPRVKASNNRLFKKSLEFLPEGFYQEKAERMREKAEADAMRAEMRRQAALASEAGENVAAALLLTEQKYFEDPPDVECGQIRLERISHYIEHPVPLRTPRDRKQTPVMPLMLTEKERKRLRHQQRVERAREEQMMIQMGLKAPPPPKVKLSNMMRVFGNEAVQDPTKVEAQVRAQMEQRRQEHEAANAARALTAEEKKEKREKKINQDRDRFGVWVAVFRVISLQKPQHRFKIDRNAQELRLSGCCIIFRDCNVIVVEGSFKSIQKYKKLCLRRIKWTEEDQDEEKLTGNDMTYPMEEEISDTKKSNCCVLIWEGAVMRPAFRDFRFATIPTEEAVRSYFEKHRVEHYFDMAITYPIHDLELINQQTKQALNI